MTLLILILTATGSALRTFGNTQVSLERVIVRVDEIRAVSTFLRNAFSGTIVADIGAMTLGGDVGMDAAYFRMKQGEVVEWRSTAMFGEQFGGSYFFTVFASDGQLILQWQVAKGLNPDNWTGKPSRVLIENLESFKSSCWSRVDEKWNTIWDNPADIPDKVRLAIRSSERYWPDLIMRIGG